MAGPRVRKDKAAAHFLPQLLEGWGSPLPWLRGRYRAGVRPGGAGGEPVLVTVGLELAQLVGLDEKNEELTTKVYLNLRWRDPRLSWDPPELGGAAALRVPADNIWLPDVGLDNNNDGEFGVSLGVRAVVTSGGDVTWRPPGLFRSRCPIRVSHFPFDWQNCSLNFRSGSYGPRELRLQLGGAQVALPPDFQENGQWTLVHRSGSTWGPPGSPEENGQWTLVHRSGSTWGPPGSPEGVSFHLVLRRKPLFYLATVLVPCVLITLLAVGVFHLPPDAGEKMSLSLFALLTLTVFLLLLADKVPATSLQVPLIGRYLTATLVLLTLVVALSVGVLNLHHRSPGTHGMPTWARQVFLQRLPPLLGLRPSPTPDEYFLRRPSPLRAAPNPPGLAPKFAPPEVREAAAAIGAIARSLRHRERRQQAQDEWRALAMAADRLCLWAVLGLTGACALGTGLDAALHRPPASPFP
ncbi:acetylcholine receptor subunit beta [Catharus ustulatus]|uniref:acetylcholine receptor subunit beta n=1 Tax=Catharus ustulatus TaxID=91951 RepID=UPI001C5B07DF|nr:acetylcholine receptor subunit beta [Catharus ustulatus]